MGERGAAGGAWGARGEAAWWPGAGELQHQQQINEEIARSTAASTHQLYTYKMTGSFSNSGVENTNSNFDYRMIPGSNTREEPQQQNWWYSSGSVESHQSSSPTGQNQSSPEREQSGQDIQQQQQLQQTQSLQQQLQQQNLQQVLQNQSLQQSLQQSQQQTLQQMLQQQQLEQQQQQQQQQQEQQQQQQQQQNLQNQQQQVLQNLQQTLQVSQSQAQAIVQAQAALQQQVAQSLHQQQQTLQDHIQAIQQQQIQAALQRQSATLQELQQQQQQQQQQSVVVPTGGSKGRMPRARAFNKPRGRMTAYAFFLQTCREEHRKKHPDENVIFATFSKKCAERWNTMSEKEKARFHEMAEQDKKRYDMEMLNYVPPKDVKIGRGRKRHQIKDPNAPKRSLSAFFWFCNDERSKVKANNPEYTMGDIAKELGRRWAAADPTHKAKYEALSEQDKARYDREMTAYKKGPLALVHQQHQQHQQQQQMQPCDDVGDDDNGEYE